jgi:excisionase family DNA binding protein
MHNKLVQGAIVRPIVVKPKTATLFGIGGLTRIYELLNEGQLESYRDGRSRLITVASIEAYVKRKIAEAHSEKAT